MDAAYDHIAEETFGTDRAPTPTPQNPGAGLSASSSSTSSATTVTGSTSTPRPNLNTELQETFQAFSNSPWGTKLGGLWGSVRKQGEQYYEDARREVEEATGEAKKGLSDITESIAKQTKNISFGGDLQADPSSSNFDSGHQPANNDGKELHKKPEGDTANDDANSADLEDGEGVVSRLKTEAAKRLRDIEKAEEAADEALTRFGTNIRNFLRDAVAIAPPAQDEDQNNEHGNRILFESKDASGERVIHSSRFDAQLHVIHSNVDNFRQDPDSGQWSEFKAKFDLDDENRKTEIARDLEKYPALQKARDQLVPDNVSPADFWSRYYFLRMVIEVEEQKRRELLRGASNPSAEGNEEIDWDADTDSESEAESKLKSTSTAEANQQRDLEPDSMATPTKKSRSAETSTTASQIPPPHPRISVTTPTNPPPNSRPQIQQQQDDSSEASYDLVSRATSGTAGSPRDEEEPEARRKEDEEEDEEDWE